MDNALMTFPGKGMFDYRIAYQRFKNGRDKKIGFLCSLGAHVLLLTIGGLVFIKPVQFAVDAGLSSMEVQLVSMPEETTAVMEKIPEAVISEPPSVVIPLSEPVKEIAPVPSIVSNEGAITETKPDYLNNPAPRYPYEARMKSWEGTVLLKVQVSNRGQPLVVEVGKASGHKVLDDAALKKVKTWRFKPALLGNVPIESSVLVPVRFRLEDLARR